MSNVKIMSKAEYDAMSTEQLLDELRNVLLNMTPDQRTAVLDRIEQALGSDDSGLNGGVTPSEQ